MGKAICIYCASSQNVAEAYFDGARQMGEALARRGHSLVYGGGKVGLMGVLADAVLENGGKVVGVIPEKLVDLELAHEGATELVVTSGMHERKATMAERADAFVALPGGFGTFEEITEVIAHHQLEYHAKPCIILNQNGFFDHLVAMFDHAHSEGFISSEHRKSCMITTSVIKTLDMIEDFK